MNAFGIEIPPSAICVFKEEVTKYDALERMIDGLLELGTITDREPLCRALFEREAIRSTGFKCVAIPHVRIDEITQPTVNGQ